MKKETEIKNVNKNEEEELIEADPEKIIESFEDFVSFAFSLEERIDKIEETINQVDLRITELNKSVNVTIQNMLRDLKNM